MKKLTKILTITQFLFLINSIVLEIEQVLLTLSYFCTYKYVQMSWTITTFVRHVYEICIQNGVL